MNRSLVLRSILVILIFCGLSFPTQAASSGQVVGWGVNSYGQTTIPPALDQVIAVATGFDHVLILRSNGTVSAWGRNNEGQTSIPPGLCNVVAVCCQHPQRRIEERWH